MATASTTVLTALVVLALGNLQIIDALVNPCIDAKTGLTNNGEIGLVKKDLGKVTLQKYVKNFKLYIPTNKTCVNPVGVSMRVCDFPAVNDGGVLPVVTFKSLDVAYVRVDRNNDLKLDDFAQVSVFCLLLPPTVE